MKVVKKIFFDDCKNLAKNFFALVIAIGICFLPALYAWFNIYSNWDPYGNTGALKLAAISLDEGFVTTDGTKENVGETVIEQLHDNTSVDWQFVDSEEEAIEGVHNGTYYAAVVIDKDFTYNMYNIFSEDATSPTLHFYQNQKINPVATKISDTVISTLQNNIDESFVEVVTKIIFSGTNDVYNDLQEDGGINGLIEKLKTFDEDLVKYENTISGIIEADNILEGNLNDAKADATYLSEKATSSSNSLNVANGQMAASQVTLNQFAGHMNSTMDVINASLGDINKILAEGTLANDVGAMSAALQKCLDDNSAILSELNALAEAIVAATPGADITDIKDAIKQAEKMQELINKAIQTQDSDQLTKSIKASEEAIRQTIVSVQGNVSDLQLQLNNQIIPEMNTVIDNLEEVLNNSSKMMVSMSTTFMKMNTMFTSLQDTLVSADTSLEKTNAALKSITERIEKTIQKVESVSDSEKVKVLVETLAGDPDVYAAFFSEPVEIETKAVYPIENYGSAVAPFYTTLAIWVGALILTAIIKVHPNKKKYPDATNTQLFFGRYILYWVLAQVQAVVIVFGDIEIFKIQCLHPGWFMLAASVTATTFSLLIYSLVVTWGDVGKALSVVIVVLQIAGSSGTYPIELLPEFFQKVYIFFPFPYAINAMRECICGMYEQDYTMFLLKLCLFIIVALVIGLLLKIPFEEINHYMEERMEDTEMM